MQHKMWVHPEIEEGQRTLMNVVFVPVTPSRVAFRLALRIRHHLIDP